MAQLEFPRFGIQLAASGWRVWDRLRARPYTNCPNKEWCERKAEDLNFKHRQGLIPIPAPRKAKH